MKSHSAIKLVIPKSINISKNNLPTQIKAQIQEPFNNVTSYFIQ